MQANPSIRERDPRIAGAIFSVFVFCVLSAPGVSIRTFFLYAAVLVVLMRLTGVPLAYCARKSLVLLPFIGVMGLLMVLVTQGRLSRLAAFWNVVAKSYLVAIGAIFLMAVGAELRNPAGACGNRAPSRCTSGLVALHGFLRKKNNRPLGKSGFRALVAIIIILLEIRLLG